MKSYGETDGDGWQQDRATDRVAGLKLPAPVPRRGLPARPPESTLGQMLTGEQKSAVSRGCGLAGAVQMNSLGVEAGKRERDLT